MRGAQPENGHTHGNAVVPVAVDGHTTRDACRTLDRHAVVAFVDGSVHWIGDFVNISGTNANANPPRYSVWDRLMLSKDGQSVQMSQFE